MLEEIKEIILEYVDTDENLITPKASLRFDLGASSFDLMNIAVAIENKYKLRIPDSKLPVMKNIGDLLCFIEANA